MILRYAAAWLLLMIAAVANGAVRELVYRSAVGELAAHQISTVTAILLFGAIVWLLWVAIAPYAVHRLQQGRG